MISRGLWFVAGAGASMYAMIKARRAMEAFTPDGLRDRAEAARLGARLFVEEVRAGSDQHELELRQRYGLRPAGPPALPSRPTESETRTHG